MKLVGLRRGRVPGIVLLLQESVILNILSARPVPAPHSSQWGEQPTTATDPHTTTSWSLL